MMRRNRSKILPMHAPDPQPGVSRLHSDVPPWRCSRSWSRIAIAIAAFWLAMAIFALLLWWDPA